MEFNNVIFYNYFHSGDIHVSRTFVKWISQNIQANNYFYWHNNSTRILLDQPKIKHRIPPYEQNKDKGIFIDGNNLFINTWYYSLQGKYYTGCNINSLYDYFKNEISVTGLEIIDDKYNFIPEIDFSYYDINGIDEKMKEFEGRKKVYFVNVNAMSGQSDNRIPMNQILKYLAQKYQDFVFFVTNKVDVISDNIVYIEDLLQHKWENLNELAYVSTFCDIIIGRYSGPHSFAYMKDNFYKNKLFLSITTPTVNGDIDFGLGDNVKTTFAFTNLLALNDVNNFLTKQINIHL